VTPADAATAPTRITIVLAFCAAHAAGVWFRWRQCEELVDWDFAATAILFKEGKG
jgi:hypothetical protein